MKVFRPSGIAASFHYLIRSLSRVIAGGSDSLRFRHHPKPNFDTAARGEFSPMAGVATDYGIMDDNFSYIGIQEIWGGEKAVGLSLFDRRQHLYLIGNTGSEKNDTAS